MIKFKIIGQITEVETIAVGKSIRDLARLRREYGRGRWRKLKGVATVQLVGGTIRLAEVHWYEAHGIGRVDHKIKSYLD
ncbi:MAG TPA: hypothetical protein VK363_06905 [Pyrinomonadaceae bacterium]|nr:hypothetical protein [Pyrinomonadaceae bacterium]